jgi:hypothetical protein
VSALRWEAPAASERSVPRRLAVEVHEPGTCVPVGLVVLLRDATGGRPRLLCNVGPPN